MHTRPTVGRCQAMKEKILTISTKLFAEQGYEKTSVADIIKALGISKGGLYHYFASKEEILSAIASEYAKTATEHITDVDYSNYSNQEKFALIAKGKQKTNPVMQELLIGVLKSKDPKVVDALIGALRTTMIPVIERLFFSDIKNSAERAARAYMVFFITQADLSFPQNLSEDAEFIKRIHPLKQQLLSSLVAGKA